MAWKKKERNSKTNRTQIVAGFVTCAKQFSPQTHFLQANDEREENNLFPQNSENLHRVLRTSERKLLHILISCRCKNFFSMSLKDKICIVTGAAVGLGRAFCEQLLKQGAFVRKKASAWLKVKKSSTTVCASFLDFYLWSWLRCRRTLLRGVAAAIWKESCNILPLWCHRLFAVRRCEDAKNQ